MKNQKMKKIVSSLLFSTMLISGLAITGCGSSDKNPTESTDNTKNEKETLRRYSCMFLLCIW